MSTGPNHVFQPESASARFKSWVCTFEVFILHALDGTRTDRVPVVQPSRSPKLVCYYSYAVTR